MYHYVHDGDLPTAREVIGLSSVEFRGQLDRLCRELEPIDWPTLYAGLQDRAALPEKALLLTFDDGLRDHAETVLEVLEERRLRGVFFVPGAILATHHMLSAHAIHLLLASMGQDEFLTALLRYLSRHSPDRDWIAAVDDAAAMRMYHYETTERARLKYLLTAVLPLDLRNAAVEALFERYVGSSERWARNWYLGWDDLIRLKSLGHTIGGHGFSHEPYARLTTAERHRDVYRAATVLQEGLGPQVRPFSYPYGSHDSEMSAICHDAGFVHAFTTEPGWINRDSRQMQLPRVDCANLDVVLREKVECAQS